jgi:hypothetical protein
VALPPVGSAVICWRRRSGLAIRGVRCQPVAFGGNSPGREPEHADAGGGDERLVGAGEGFAGSVDRPAIGVVAAGERDVVLEREVDGAVGGHGGVAQGVELVSDPERASAPTARRPWAAASGRASPVIV